jgi:hypothetical protein
MAGEPVGAEPLGTVRPEHHFPLVRKHAQKASPSCIVDAHVFTGMHTCAAERHRRRPRESSPETDSQARIAVTAACADSTISIPQLGVFAPVVGLTRVPDAASRKLATHAAQPPCMVRTATTFESGRGPPVGSKQMRHDSVSFPHLLPALATIGHPGYATPGERPARTTATADHARGSLQVDALVVV